MSWIGDKAEATANVLKDLLTQTPAAKLYRQGLPNVLDALLNAREEEWRAKVQAMPKPFDASPEAVNRDMEAAMAFWNPAGMLGKIVYHGSPHKFDKLDANLAGTRGGTSFGKGHNFSADIEHAKVYSGKGGNLYKVDIPDDELASFMSWESPTALAKKVPPIDESRPLPFGGGAFIERGDFGARLKSGGSDFRLSEKDYQRMFGDAGTGEQVYRKLVAALGSEDAANAWLTKNGVRGIKNTTEHAAENYVLFPGLEDKVKILERNGQPVNALAEILK